MVNLDKFQIASLKRLMNDDAWDILTNIVLLNHIIKIKDIEISGNNEFETLRALHKNQGKVEGLTEFFDSIEKSVFD